MRSYIELTKSVILEKIQLSGSDKPLLFRVEDAPHPQVYWEIASYFDEWASGNNTRFVGKLAHAKYLQFLESADASSRRTLEQMRKAGYIDEENHMTYWRNQAIESDQLTILMGTETVEDKGGLGDFFAVTSDVLDQVLDGQYSKWFSRVVGDLTDIERRAIDHVIQHIFRVTTRNLFHLSSIVDELQEQGVYDTADLLARLFDRLDNDWGLPRVSTKVPSARDLSHPATVRSLFDQLAQFRNRQSFRELGPKRMERLIDSIREKEIDADLASQAPGYHSLEQLKEDLVRYVTGEDLPRVQPLILGCDYTLVRSILEVKSRKYTTRITTPKVYGSPLKAFLSIIIDKLAEEKCVNSLEFSITSARLAACSTDGEMQEQWQRLRLVTGGILEFLNAEFNETCDVELRWANGQDPFEDAAIGTDLDIGRAAATKKLSTIEFSIVAGTGGKPNYYVWEFDPRAPWLYTFFHVYTELNDAYQNRYGNKYLPLLHVERFPDLLTSNNEEEFFSSLETAIVVKAPNVIQLLQQRLAPQEHAELLQRIENLGEHFTQFLTDLNRYGFYASQTGNRIQALIECYCRLIDWLGGVPLTSVARDALVALANAFLIVDANHDPLSKGLTGAVVLPCHPAMLEKLIAQAQFIRDGATEIIQDMRSANDDAEAVKKAEQRLKTFEQLSTISLAVDTLWSTQGTGYLPATHTFGFFAIYREPEVSTARISLNSVLTDDVAADEDIPAREVLRESPISEVIYNKLNSYLKTFPSQVDGLHIVFVNPPDLQPVVAGIHRLIDSLRNRSNGSKVKVRLTVLAPHQSLGSRSYLHFWLDNFFEDTDDVDITTYFKTISFRGDNLARRIRRALGPSAYADVTFVQNVMGVTQIQFDPSASDGSEAPLTRFPMVFHPLPVFRTSSVRRTSITQRQFAASSAHARLVFYLSAKTNNYIDCGVINELQLQPNYSELLEVLHEYSRWVVCIDAGIDREIISTKEQRIISFATGVGPFGELNVTVSSRRDSYTDLRTKLEGRLRSLFSRWNADTLKAAANRCLEIAERLDGAHLLGALNPDDRQLHSFLAYILTARYLDIGAFDDPNTLVRTLVPLDSYEHWFRPDIDPKIHESARRPDFLLLEVNRGNNGDELTISATVIECKMGRNLQQLIEEGREQLSRGVRVLQAIWNPKRESIDKRYWHSQLYRALVFSTVNMAENDQMYWEFNKKIQAVLDGKFSISWRALLLTYWLDSPSDSVATFELPLENCGDAYAEHHEFGQVAIQKMLIDAESEIEYTPIPDSELMGYGEEVRESGHDATIGASFPASTAPTLFEYPTTASRDHTDTTTSSLHMREASGSGAPMVSFDEAETTNRLHRIRLLIGEDVRTGEKVYWEYGHPQLQNRHILITGSSGSGKTYFIQALILELSFHGVSSLIFDYTDGFTPQKLEPEFVERLRDKIAQWPIYHEPFPLNPFKRYPIEIAGELTLQKPVDVAERIKNSFTRVFDLGPQQANALYNAVKNGMAKHGEAMTLANLEEELSILGEKLPNARTALQRLQPLIDRNPFDHTSSRDWSILDRIPGSIVVVQLSGFTRDVQVAITQLILWDAWYYKLLHGDKSKPFPVILDEAQNLDHSETSPTAMILTEGRKFGWSGWFATQFLKGQIQTDELGRLQQASQKIFFKPPEAELKDVALMIDPDRTRAQEWQIKLARLQKGQCVVSGWIDRNGRLDKDQPRIVRVTPLSERGGAPA